MPEKDIELRSEEVQEVMGHMPSWILRWGITLFFVIILTLLIGSFFFRYPDTITATMTLTSDNPGRANNCPGEWTPDKFIYRR